MDFEKVLKFIINEFKKQGVDYALIGGFAMGALGVMRATMDLDFLLNRKDISQIEKIMEKYNYKCVFKTENVSQYVSEIKHFGEIDFIHAFRKISISMLKRAREIAILGGKYKAKVLNPEDIIGLKLQASVNDESRKMREYTDIEAIMDYYKEKLDWDLLKEYFVLFEKENDFNKLKKKYGNNK
jgi:hypothetical protein